MNAQQKKWASQHDWFIRETITGVVCRDYDEAGNEIEVTFTTYTKLRDWAGY